MQNVDVDIMYNWKFNAFVSEIKKHHNVKWNGILKYRPNLWKSDMDIHQA